MQRGVPGEYYDNGQIFGMYNDKGILEVYGEYGTDEEFDRYSVEVQNGDGYYDCTGRFVRYRDYD